MTEHTDSQNDALLQKLCDQATHEQDPERLLSLTKQTCEILDKKRTINSPLVNSRKSA